MCHRTSLIRINFHCEEISWAGVLIVRHLSEQMMKGRHKKRQLPHLFMVEVWPNSGTKFQCFADVNDEQFSCYCTCNDCGIYLHSFESVASFQQDQGNCLPLQFLRQSHPDEQHQNKSNDNLLPKVTLLLKLIVKRWRAVNLGTLRPLGSLHRVTLSREISMATKRAGNPHACSHQLTTPHWNEFSGTYWVTLHHTCKTVPYSKRMGRDESFNPQRFAKCRQSNKIHKDQLKATKQATSPCIHPTDYASVLENPTSHIGMGLTLPKLYSATFERHTIDMIISGFNVI